MPINFSSSTIAFTSITGDGYQPTCVVLSLTHTLKASFVLLPPTANRLRIWIFKRWPSQLPSSRTFWWEFSWTSAWMARSSPRYALKIWNIFRFSYSNADWFTDHWNTPIIIATAGDSSVSRVAFRCAESVEGEIGEHFLRFTDDGGNYPRN